MFRAELPDGAELAEIYGRAYFESSDAAMAGQGYGDYLGDEENHRSNSVARLRLLERHRSPGYLLDIGCAAGFFLDEARNRGWHVHGVEFSPEMARFAKERLALDVDNAAFADAELGARRFDVITMWDYIEHSVDPHGDVERAWGLLEPRGLLAISTGDAASVVARLSGRRWHLLTPRHHNFFFTRASLLRLMRGVGFEVELCAYRSSLYSVSYLFHKLQTFADVSPLRRAAAKVATSRAGQVPVPINLFDIVTVVGRRP